MKPDIYHYYAELVDQKGRVIRRQSDAYLSHFGISDLKSYGIACLDIEKALREGSESSLKDAQFILVTLTKLN